MRERMEREYKLNWQYELWELRTNANEKHQSEIILKAREENWVNVFNAFYRKAKERKVFTWNFYFIIFGMATMKLCFL